MTVGLGPVGARAMGSGITPILYLFLPLLYHLFKLIVREKACKIPVWPWYGVHMLAEPMTSLISSRILSGCKIEVAHWQLWAAGAKRAKKQRRNGGGGCHTAFVVVKQVEALNQLVEFVLRNHLKGRQHANHVLTLVDRTVS